MASPANSGSFPPAEIQGSDHTYTAGAQAAQMWNGAAVGPALAATHATRTANTFSYTPDGLFTDSAPAGLGHDGIDPNSSGVITLRQRHKVIRTERFSAHQPPSPFKATLQATPAAYALTVTAQRKVNYARLSTSITAAWRFRSRHTAGTQALPLMAVRFAVPGLSDKNQATAGSTLAIPVYVIGDPGAPRQPVPTVAVQMSADGGHTWHRVPLWRVGGHWIADVTSPAGTGFVSLQATVTNADADSVVETIINAYAMTP